MTGHDLLFWLWMGLYGLVAWELYDRLWPSERRKNKRKSKDKR